MEKTKEEKLLRVLMKTISRWEEREGVGYLGCPFCQEYSTITSLCKKCPIRHRFGDCAYGNFNPYALHEGREERREAVLKAGYKWLAQLVAKKTEDERKA